MASNTKLGVVLILLIVGAFGVTVYKKVEKFKRETASIDHSNDAPPPADDKDTFGPGKHQPFEKDEHAGHNHGNKDTFGVKPAPAPKPLDKPKVLPASDEFVVQKAPAPAPKPAVDPKKSLEPFDADPAFTKKPAPAPGDQLAQKPAPPPKSHGHAHDKDEFGSAESFEKDDAAQKKPHGGEEDFEDPFGGEGDKVVDAKTRPAPPPKDKDDFADMNDTFQKEPEPNEKDAFAKDDNFDKADMFDGPAPDPRLAQKAKAPDDKADFRKHKEEGFVEGSHDMFGKPGPRPKKPKELPEPSELPEPIEQVDSNPPRPVEIPEPEAPAPVHPKHPDHETYVVQTHDNFWNISRKKYGTARFFRVLAEMNRAEVPNADELYPGTRIIAPSREFMEANAAQILEAAETQLVCGYYQEVDGRRHYRVGPHDTLPDIAERHLGRNARWIQIFELNRDKLSSPDDLHAGVDLLLPPDARRGVIIQAMDDDR